MNLTAILLFGMAGGIGQAPVGPASGYIPMKSRSLELPIQYEAERRKDIQEVKLFVSEDRGGTWQNVDRVTSDKESFKFTARNDGLYYVNMVIAYRNGQLDPPNVAIAPPAAKLLIDTTPPVVRIDSARREGEEIVVEWTIEDKYPNDAVTQVAYKSSSPTETTWLPVPTASLGRRKAKFKPTVSGPLVVQVTGQDLVGNVATKAQEMPGTSTSFTMPTLPGVTPTAEPGPLNVVPVSTASAPLAAPLPPPDMRLETMPTAPVSPVPAVASPAPIAVQPAPAVVSPTTFAPASSQLPAPAGSFQPLSQPSMESDPARPIAVGTGSSATPPAAVDVGVQVINYARFDLQYQLENGPSGVSRVDLYVTRDEGRSWTRWSQHDGRQTPLRVILDTQSNQQPEGDYGFRLVPVSGAGLAEDSPTAGVQPEMRVHVDRTPPVIKVYKPKADVNQRNTLVILWEATDRNFGKDPVAIEWSENKTGPWKSVTNGDTVVPVVGGQRTGVVGVPNTGQYNWQLPAGMPSHQVYLKFSAWDVAGNRSEVVTPDPVLVDLTKPRAKIQGILGSAAVRP